ncbi:crotonobetainyl-CoA:carnitine CoA-transferase CaiB-like acyl-CoA transferase [Antricoccus suffuscus]|uniref:Crotonobetainyl-CoA:carnitine CoA-transferase CaiB-like acyl-CoA transferase n=1 Tax=Antricoccus suffuscus TaxID=1629062 RepID=A0A2T0ZUE9_9ACTN|nr:CoA transferase [Antricoccus suffuscus]PRZ39708.1 crotonobetainyl-CoA:carnitine CoA-transferase CaiB-like acyl-CoA transferase [Antricoccus suffuscus]
MTEPAPTSSRLGPEELVQTGALTGLRVVELGSTLMGPYCTMLLAQWGADVVKVEPPAGDPARYIGDLQRTGMGPFFLNANRGKRSVVLDLKMPDGARGLEELLSTCDIVVHTLRPDAATALGLDAASIVVRHPQCIAVALRGFGRGGPAAEEPAYDDIIQARSGVAALQGGHGEPTYVRSTLVDKVVALHGLAALLAALRQRDLTGRGMALEIPMFETMAAFNLVEQQGGLVFDPPTGPPGYRRTASSHRRPYATKDGSVAVMLYTDRHWRVFFDLIGRPELAKSPRYRTIRERTEHIDELYRLLAETLLERTSQEWIDLLGPHKIPIGSVNGLSDLVDDPQLIATDFFTAVEHPAAGSLRLPRLAGPTGANPPPARDWAPLLGADTEAVVGGSAAG